MAELEIHRQNRAEDARQFDETLAQDILDGKYDRELQREIMEDKRQSDTFRGLFAGMEAFGVFDRLDGGGGSGGSGARTRRSGGGQGSNTGTFSDVNGDGVVDLDDIVATNEANRNDPFFNFGTEAIGDTLVYETAGRVAREIFGDNAVGGAAQGAARGAAIGSIVPGVGTKIGAVVGGILGGGSKILGVNFSGHTDRKIESSWHPAILDALYQNGYNLRENVPKTILDELARELRIPEKVAFRRSPDHIERQDKEWEKAIQNGTMSYADVNEQSLQANLRLRGQANG
jgi:hypothetical protein